jgi:hypothetical protein
MHKIAPNLSAVTGSETAARLMGLAGGLVNLSRMPACNIQVGPAGGGHLPWARGLPAQAMERTAPLCTALHRLRPMHVRL